MKKIIILIYILINVISNTYSQSVSGYVFEKSRTSFIELSNTTILFDNSIESVLSEPIVLPSEFTFAGIQYSSIRVHPQGWVSLGGENISINGNNLTSLSSPILAAFWDDFNVTNNPELTYQVGYQIQNTNSGDDFIVEWKNMEWNLGAIVGDPVSKITFQLIFHLYNNQIEYRYKPSNDFEFNYDPTAGAIEQNQGATIGIGGVSFGSENLLSFTEVGMGTNTYHINSIQFNDQSLLISSSSNQHNNNSANQEITFLLSQETGTLYPSQTGEKVLKVDIQTPATSNGSTLNSIKINLSGSSNLYDIDKIKLYKTDNISSFNEPQFISQQSVSISQNEYLFNLNNQILTTGDNYFWIAVDINENAISGNLVDAEIQEIKINSLVKSIINGNPIGASLILNHNDYANRGLSIPPPINYIDYLKNWSEVLLYDETGNVISQTRTYQDLLGRATQTQNLVGNTVLASQTVYDLFGRVALNTLPAPITTQSEVGFKNDLLTNTNGNPYSYLDFDLYNSNSSLNKIINPNPVGQQTGTIGRYYSNTNTLEPYVASSNFPYSRYVYSNDPNSTIYQSSLAGEKHRIGSGHESFTFKMLSAGELSYIYGYMRSYLQDVERSQGDVLDNSIGDVLQLNKTISIDQNGQIGISFTNNSGALIASCLTGQGNLCEVQKVSSELSYYASKFDGTLYNSDAYDLHLPVSKNSSLSFEAIFNNDIEMSSIEFTLIDLKSDKKLVLNTDYTLTLDPLNNAVKKVTFLPPYNTKDLVLRVGYTWLPPAICATCKLKYIRVRYELDYSHWNMNYFDAKGNLLRSVQPNAVNCNFNPLTNSHLVLDNDYEAIRNGLTNNFFIKALNQGANIERTLRINIFPEVKLNLSAPISYRLSGSNNVNDIKFVGTTSNKLIDGNDDGGSGGGGQHTTYSQTIRYVRFKYRFNLYGHNSSCTHSQYEICANKINTVPVSAYFTLIIKENELGEVSCEIKDYEIGSSIFSIDNYKLKDYTSYNISIVNALFSNNWGNNDFISFNLSDAIDDVSGKYYVETSNNTKLYYHEILKFHVNYEERDFNNFLGLSNSLLTSTYKYDNENRAIEFSSPDEGITKRIYDDENKLRFTQNAEQRLTGKFSYVNYDKADRVVEVGVYDPNLAGNTEIVPNYYYFFEMPYQYNGEVFNNKKSIITLLNNDGVLDIQRCVNQTYYSYDLPSLDIPITLSNDYPQVNTQLRMTKSWNSENVSWYGYDYLGRMTWTVQALLGLGTKTIDYEYDDYFSTVSKITFQKGDQNQKFQHLYSYDNRKRIETVSTLQGASNTPELQASYQYYTHGPLKRTEFGTQVQGIDYVYTINGWLKSINNAGLNIARDPGKDNATGVHAGFAKDVFGMELDYFDGDYNRLNTYIQNSVVTNPTLNITNKYNGMIKAQRWNTLLPSGAANSYQSNSQLMFAYSYNSQQMLNSAVFGTVNPGAYNGNGTDGDEQLFSERPEYRLSNISYDLNGNITNLKRDGNISSNNYQMDDFTYSYYENKNQLKRLTDASNSVDYSDDLDNQINTENYEYNSLGQMTKDKSKDIRIEYNHFGFVDKIIELSTNNLKIQYFYNERAQKVMKKVFGVSESSTTRSNLMTYYVNDRGGNTLAIYEGLENQTFSGGMWVSSTSPSLKVSEYTIFGMGRIGVQQMASTEASLKTVYELSDHLGNVRAVISSTKVNGQAEVLSYTDYYPHGTAMPGRNYVSSNDYRYAYQGQEKEQNKWIGFDLRMYDGNIGRWMSPDPFGEFHSPYLAMGNDPINRIDPTGGVTSGAANREIREMQAGSVPDDGFAMLDALMAAADMRHAMNLAKEAGLDKIQSAESEADKNTATASYIALLQNQTQYILNVRSSGWGYGAGNPLIGAAPAISASGKPINMNVMMRESMEIYADEHPFAYKTCVSNNEPRADLSNKFMSSCTVHDDGRLDMNWVNANTGYEQGNGGGSDIDIYLCITGGIVSGMELSYLSDAKQVLKYGQRIDGKVRSAETLTRANRISSTATVKYIGYAGKALGIYGAYDAGTKLLNNPSNPANWVKFGASTGMLFMKTNPFTFVVGVGYTVLDQGGYIDDWIGNKP